MFKDAERKDAIAAAYERFRAKTAGATSRMVKTRHGDTHVLSAGPPNAPPLIVVHGALASSAHVMGELGPLLSRFRVHAPDVIGQSVKSEDRRIALDGNDYGEWLEDVMDGLGLRRAHVYGVSWGGFVACKLAASVPQRIDRLVLLVPAGFVNGSAWEGLTKVAIPLALFRAFPSEARLTKFASGILTTLDDDWVPYLGEAFRSYNLDIRVPPLFTPEALARFDRPALVFGASHDVSFPGRALVARAKVLLPRAETELLENCRHSPPTDDASRARLADRVTRFLTGTAAAVQSDARAISIQDS
jgi:pimeloyl-ACP methyl ester carboxylesterase